jgi:hypothetical protein
MARGEGIEDDKIVQLMPGQLALSRSGGPHDPGLEARVAKLEAHIEHIQTDLHEIKSDIREIKRDARTDFRLVFGALIVAALGLAGVMAKGFHWIGG